MKDERDIQLEKEAKSYASEWMVAIAEVFMIICLVKGSTAWRGFLSVALFGAFFVMIKRYSFDKDKPWLYVGIFFLIAALALGIWYYFSL